MHEMIQRTGVARQHAAPSVNLQINHHWAFAPVAKAALFVEQLLTPFTNVSRSAHHLPRFSA